jgi:hypothetical protein
LLRDLAEIVQDGLDLVVVAAEPARQGRLVLENERYGDAGLERRSRTQALQHLV